MSRRQGPDRARIPLSRRALDLFVLALLTPLLILPLLIVTLAVFLDSPGSVFFRARRMGFHGRPFAMIKFRTMRIDNAGHSVAGANDSRITPVGGFLRATRLDELPQLWNVLRGEMTLVGPRPLPLRDHARLEHWHRRRSNVLPGMTGLWQIAGRSDLSFDDLVRLDFYYLENWSLWLDITILVKTLPAVVVQRGAY